MLFVFSIFRVWGKLVVSYEFTLFLEAKIQVTMATE